MKVLVLGGYGVFGERVVRLLRRDGHEVIVAGRNLTDAQRLAVQVGAQAMRLDRQADLARLPALGIDVLIDAAGPFHTYGDAPHALAEACLHAGVHYLDLADDASFCVGIGTLDDLARRQGRMALSGASSVPAISAAVVRALSCDLECVDAVDTAILPGNRAPRGLSVIASILEQCGRERAIWLDAGWRTMRGWSSPRSYRLGAVGRRRGYRIGVPDLDLFPQHFGASSVSFRAGLELTLMNRSLSLLSRLRARWPFAINLRLVRVVARLAGLLKPLGSDRGGMVVEVIGVAPDQPGFTRSLRRWTLLAEGGDGPWVPAIAVRALLRKPLAKPGARACLSDLELPEIEAAMSDFRIRFEHECSTLRALFFSVPGLELGELPEPIRASHLVFHTRILQGRARVDRGRGRAAQLLCRIFGFPATCDDIEVEVTKTREAEGECWQRRFGARRFHSYLRICDGRMRERFGIFEFELDLRIADDALHFPVRRGWLLGLPLPHWLLPRSEAREYIENERFSFDVAMHAPLGMGLMVRYRGWLS